jgi:hypothetical protein
LITDLIHRISADPNIAEIENDLYYALRAEIEALMNHSNSIVPNNPGSQKFTSP